MKILVEKKPNTHMPSKAYGAFYTTPGNSEKLLEIIKEFDYYEFSNYGVNDEGVFKIPILETLEKIDEDTFILNNNVEDYEYYGKYDIYIEKLYRECEKQNIPCVFEFYSPKNDTWF